MNCFRCEDSGWVCENHPDRPWDGPHACSCGAAGEPAPLDPCNLRRRRTAAPPAWYQNGIRQGRLAALALNEEPSDRIVFEFLLVAWSSGYAYIAINRPARR